MRLLRNLYESHSFLTVRNPALTLQVAEPRYLVTACISGLGLFLLLFLGPREIFFSFFFLKIMYLFIFRERGREGEREREKHQCVVHPLLGAWPTTQACTLTGN